MLVPSITLFFKNTVGLWKKRADQVVRRTKDT